MSNGTGGFLQPKDIIEQLNIKKGIKIADFGCGAGYFAIPFAELTGEKGKIYALDVLETALESVQSRAKLKGFLNIETKHCNLEDPKGSGLEDNSMDLVCLANILFQADKKNAIIEEGKRVLKNNGEMLIIDWRPNQPMGPSEDVIIKKEEVKKIAENQGLKFKKEFAVDKYHWGLIFTNAL